MTFIFFFLKKKTGHGVVLNGTVHVLLPCACRGREEEVLIFPARYSLSPPHLPEKPGTTHTHHTLPT
jgi:hypothetical protein